MEDRYAKVQGRAERAMRYFADTYALIEILKGNPNYERYSQEELITTEFNLLELAYALTRDFGEERALSVLKAVRAYVTLVKPTDEDYVKASRLRLELKKERKNLSLVDSLGYVIALRLGIPFLTGDKAFENMPNVGCVK